MKREMRTHHTDIKVTFKSGSGLQHVTVTIRTRLDLLPTISRAALPPQAPGENPPLLLPASRRSKHFLASGCLTPVSACLHRAFSSSPCVLSYSVFFSETMIKTSLEHSHTHSCVFTHHTHTHTHTHTRRPSSTAVTETHSLRSQKCLLSGALQKKSAGPCSTASILFIDSVQKLSYLKYLYSNSNTVLQKHESFTSM